MSLTIGFGLIGAPSVYNFSRSWPNLAILLLIEYPFATGAKALLSASVLAPSCLLFSSLLSFVTKFDLLTVLSK